MGELTPGPLTSYDPWDDPPNCGADAVDAHKGAWVHFMLSDTFAKRVVCKTTPIPENQKKTSLETDEILDIGEYDVVIIILLQ